MAKKIRVPIPEDVATQVVFRSDRTCCVCHERGRPTQIHHIDEDPSNNDPDNLAVLCLHCHEETQIKGGFGRRLNAAQVTYFRDDWQRRVEERKAAADKMAVAREAGHSITPVPVAVAPASEPAQTDAPLPARRDALPDPAKVVNYLWTLPAVRRDVYSRAQAKWDSGNSAQMRRGSADVIDVLEQILATLVAWYPPGHFGQGGPQDYINSMTAARFTWHRAHLEPNGIGTGGTIVRTMVGGCVMDDLERMILDVVSSLGGHLDDFNFLHWKQEWNSAYPATSDATSSLDSSTGEIVSTKDYAKRILGRWLGPRKYIAFYADGRWGVQRNEDAPLEIEGRRWRIEGDRLLWTFQGDNGLETQETVIVSFTEKQFITEFAGHQEVHDWAP